MKSKSSSNSPSSIGKSAKIQTTFEEREVIAVHNNLFLRTFFGSGLSMTTPIASSTQWDRKYELKQVIKEVEGI